MSRVLDLGTPNEKQKQALLAKTKYVGYGGARGGGKSWFVRTKAKGVCLHYAGITVCIIRKTYAELEANHIKPLKKELKIGTSDAFAKYNDSKKEITFPNGSQIIFRYLDNEKDYDRLHGTEFDMLFVDEATLHSEEVLKKLTSCVRGANNFPKRIYYTMNPGGVSHGYLKRLFIDRRFEKNERPEDYSFIQALVTDNIALMESDPDYMFQLEALPEKLRKAWLYGSWDIFEGQFFEDFIDDPEHYEDRQWTHVIEPFDIPPDWKIYMSYDFGYSKPFSFGWWAVDYDGVIYRICELYGCTKEPNEGVKWIAEEQFKKIKEIERTHPLLKGRKISGRVADPAIWDGSRGESIQETAAKNQIYFDKGENARIPGWMQMHYRFAFDENGYPMMYIFNTCRGFIRTIPLMIYSETHTEDLDTTMEDHIADETRYFCMSRPIPPRKKVVQQPIGEDPLNMKIDARRKGRTIYR